MLIAIILGLAVILLLLTNSRWEFDTLVGHVFTSIGLGLITMLGLTLFISMIDSNIKYDYKNRYIYSEQRLYAFKDIDGNYKGSFFIFAGSFSRDKPVYRYLVENDFGCIVEEKSIDSHVHITYTDEQPKMVIYRSSGINSIVDYIYKFPWDYSDDYVFYIPDGSILNTFEVDLK